MIPQSQGRESPRHGADETGITTTMTTPSKRHSTPADANVTGDDYRFFALAAPNASHRVMLLELRVDGGGHENRNQHQGWGADGGNKVKVREVAHLEGLGYDDEFTERLCEGADGDQDQDEDEAGGDGGGGYVLVAALVGANRKAIYRVPLAAPSPRSRLRLKETRTAPDHRSAGSDGAGGEAGRDDRSGERL